jgi:hypothetical protein
MFDITGVTEDGDYVPFATTAVRGLGESLARKHSADSACHVVYLKVAETGEIIATYVDGERDN